MTEKGKYDRTISMLCPTCGGNQFDYGDTEESPEVTCSSCGLTLEREELIRRNEAHISDHVEAVKIDVLKDVQAQFRQAFKGNKNFRLK